VRECVASGIRGKTARLRCELLVDLYWNGVSSRARPVCDRRVRSVAAPERRIGPRLCAAALIAAGVALFAAAPAVAGWGSPQAIASRSGVVAAMAGNARGAVALVLQDSRGWSVARAAPRGRFGRPVRAHESALDDRTSNGGLVEPAVAVGPSGEALLAWPQFDGSSAVSDPTEDATDYCCDQIRAATLLPDGSFGSTQRLSPRGWQTQEPLALISPGGLRVVLWTMEEQLHPGARGRVELATALPGHRFSHFHAILTSTYPAGSPPALADAVFLANGRLQITWEADASNDALIGDVSMGGKLSRVRVVERARRAKGAVESNARGQQIESVDHDGPAGNELTVAAREPQHGFGARTLVAVGSRSTSAEFGAALTTAWPFAGFGIGPGGQTLLTWQTTTPTTVKVRYALGPHLLAGLTRRTLVNVPAAIDPTVAAAIGADGEAAIQIDTSRTTSVIEPPGDVYASVGNSHTGRMSPPRTLSTEGYDAPFNIPLIDGLGDAMFAWQTTSGPIVETYTPG
jgi:hypothetical protein